MYNDTVVYVTDNRIPVCNATQLHCIATYGGNVLKKEIQSLVTRRNLSKVTKNIAWIISSFVRNDIKLVLSLNDI